MSGILIASGILLLSIMVLVAVLRFMDWGRWSKPEHGRTWYVPPRPFYYHGCKTMRWVGPAMKQVKKKMHRNAKNFVVQMGYSGAWGNSWRSYMSAKALKNWEAFLREMRDEKKERSAGRSWVIEKIGELYYILETGSKINGPGTYKFQFSPRPFGSFDEAEEYMEKKERKEKALRRAESLFAQPLPRLATLPWGEIEKKVVANTIRYSGGKERSMDRRPRKKLKGRFFRVYTEERACRLECRLMDAGFRWSDVPRPLQLCAEHGVQTCIGISKQGALAVNSLRYYKVLDRVYQRIRLRELTEILNKGKGQKMGSEVGKKLMNRFVRVFSGPENFRVQKRLFENGYTWNSSEPTKVRDYSSSMCIFLHWDRDLTWSPNYRYARGESKCTEISVQELEEILNKGKDQKMGKNVTDFRMTFVHTPNEHVCRVVQQMMLDAGLVWCSGDGEVVNDLGYAEEQCLSINDSGKMEHCGATYYREDSPFREVTISELAELLVKPKPKPKPEPKPHTLLTREKFLQKFDRARGLEGALENSIGKWEVLAKVDKDDVNWEELCRSTDKYLRGDTCGLCEWFHKIPAVGMGTCCGDCCLLDGDGRSCSYPAHVWRKAQMAVSNNNRDGFVSYAREILETMKDALVELRKPKQYRLGQFFLLTDEEGDVLTILGRTDIDHTALIAISEDKGNMWGKSLSRGAGSSSVYFTESQIADMAEGHKAVPVNVVITAKKGVKNG